MQADRLADVRSRITRAEARSGRPAGAVTLVGASKTVPAETLVEFVKAGLTDLGENRVQEAEAKMPAVLEALPAQTPSPTWHLIGHLQTNKAKKAVTLFDWIHSIDSPKLADALDRHAAEFGRRPKVLIEVNTAGEASKQGTRPEDAPALVEHVAQLPHLELRGLMTVGPLDDARPAYQALRKLLAAAQQAHESLDTLSMGMSGDLEVAIEEGATMVRVGSALFGTRPTAHRHGGG
jgi:pyridoxal phosphate enzyme (YggS family)